MIQLNARMQNLKGIYFYEQDILYDDYVYTEDITINIKANYLSPGIGIALFNSEGMGLGDQKESLLIKLGYREATLIYKDKTSQKRLKTNAVRFVPPIEDMELVFTKKEKNISLSLKGESVPLIEYTLPKNWSAYSIGYYSNKGNTLKQSKITGSSPMHWTVNVHNTDGGHISFINNGFELINCKENGEMEQSNIALKAGTYYLSYEASDLFDESCDIVSYVFLDKDSLEEDDEKNILKDNQFTLKQDTSVHLKFKGKIGRIKNISLSTNSFSNYVPTTSSGKVESSGSYIKVLISDDMLSLSWKAKIHTIPDKFYGDVQKENYVFKTNSKTLELRHLSDKPEELISKELDYFYDIRKNTFTVHDGDKLIRSENFATKSDVVMLFKNMNVNVFTFLIRKTNGQIDVIETTSTKKHLPFYINSPVIVTDTARRPYDLSSSYRFVLREDGSKEYYFTNTEREFFEADSLLLLEKAPSDISNGIRIYGIYHDAVLNEEDFYRVDKKDIDSIDHFTIHYQRIESNNIRLVDYANNAIYLDPMGDKYSHYVVEYVKEDSYCLNFVTETKTYEVDINNNNKEFLMFYDEPINVNGVISKTNNKVLNEIKTAVTPINNKFVILRKESFYANQSQQPSDTVD